MSNEPLKEAVSLYDSDASARTTLSRHAIVAGRRVDIPDGWKLAKGQVQAGDCYLNLTAWRKTGEREFVEVGKSDYQYEAGAYAMLIRLATTGEPKP